MGTPIILMMFLQRMKAAHKYLGILFAAGMAVTATLIAAVDLNVTPIVDHGTGQGVIAVTLLNAAQQASAKSATVDVKVAGLNLVDPATVGNVAQAGQGHLHYKVDDGPVIATTATQLTFQELSTGSHQITVWLAGNDNQLLGPYQTFTVRIP